MLVEIESGQAFYEQGHQCRWLDLGGRDKA